MAKTESSWQLIYLWLVWEDLIIAVIVLSKLQIKGSYDPLIQ